MFVSYSCLPATSSWTHAFLLQRNSCVLRLSVSFTLLFLIVLCAHYFVLPVTSQTADRIEIRFIGVGFRLGRLFLGSLGSRTHCLTIVQCSRSVTCLKRCGSAMQQGSLLPLRCHTILHIARRDFKPFTAYWLCDAPAV